MNDENKIIIYQVFTRLFGNNNNHCVYNGDIATNGCGKMADFTLKALGEIKKLGEELATLNRKIQLTLKPVGRHENVEGKEPVAEEQKLVSGSDVIPDLPRQAKHVPSMEIANPAKELKKIS